MKKALDKKALAKDIARDLRGKARATLAALRAKIKEAKAQRVQGIADAKKRCRLERGAARDRAKALRAKGLADLKAAAAAERAAARSSCAVGTSTAKSKAAVEASRLELAAERKYQADLRRIERANKERRREAPIAKRGEHRSESDDEVRANISADLVPLFDRVRKSIRGSDRISRTEAFLQYAEENPHEVFATLDQKTDLLIAELERQEREAMRLERRPNPAPRTPVERAAVDRYKRTHWGKTGNAEIFQGTAADPRIVPTVLGKLVLVVYETDKGRDGLSEYEHRFKRGDRPLLAENREGLLILNSKPIKIAGIVQ